MKFQVKMIFPFVLVSALSFADLRDLKIIMKEMGAALSTISKSTVQDGAELAADVALEKLALESIQVPPTNLKADEIARYTDLLKQIAAKAKLLQEANSIKDAAVKATILADILVLKRAGHLEFRKPE